MTAHISKGISEPSEKINPGIPAVGGNNDNTPITIPNTAVVLLKTGLRSITILVISWAMPSMTYPTSNAVPCQFESITCPAASRIDLCASIVTAVYWLLRPSISKADVDAK